MTRPTSNTPPEDLHQLTRISLDTHHPACQVCGQPFHEGDDITAYAYRAAGEPAYAIGYIMCGSDIHEHPTVFTRGVREYVLTGHIGTCADVRTQSMAYILLGPEAVVTSPTTSRELHVHPDTPTERLPTDTQQEKPTSLLTAIREHTHSVGSALQARSE
ncbi:hypothetical protein PM085_17975 [Halorubrum ezzemoulense]|uniref:DUF8112 domain-containing protein n=1 Tax=Halorubrum ezzemoulense TaxID=337243 RepID=A0ABT4Z7E9_HALEZ|nr:hypothetical protein [Halorubrum ezzemoulense]MDB2294113.1 hypothetical protein [Halorubrum ezzemoulense]